MAEKTDYKKKIRIALLVFAIALVLVIAVPLVILCFTESPWRVKTIHFAPRYKSVDIYSDQEYMALDRSIHYATNDGYTIAVALKESEYALYDEGVQMLIRLVRAAERGDEKAYNACFSKEYLEKSGPDNDITMQKIYDIYITDYRQKNVTVPEGYEKVALYGLRYKIKDNNGSLRYDIGSDAEREQYISVVTDATGNAFVYGIQIYYSN